MIRELLKDLKPIDEGDFQCFEIFKNFDVTLNVFKFGSFVPPHAHAAAKNKLLVRTAKKMRVKRRAAEFLGCSESYVRKELKKHHISLTGEV